MHSAGEQSARRDVEADIVQGQIDPIAVADRDPFDMHVERHCPADPIDRDGEVRDR